MAKVLTICKRHDNQLLEEPINLSYSKSRYCPCCGHKSNTRPYDEYDLLSVKYNVPRQTIRYIDSTRISEFPKSESLQEFIVMVLEAVPSKVNTGYAPITISCNSCRSLFRFHRASPSGNHISPKHCIFCGSSEIVIHTQDLDLDYWEVLAQSYKMTAETIKLFYDAFAAQNQYLHFNEFMQMLKRQLKEGQNNAAN